jgi:hypothetical protein
MAARISTVSQTQTWRTMSCNTAVYNVAIWTQPSVFITPLVDCILRRVLDLVRIACAIAVAVASVSHSRM